MNVALAQLAMGLKDDSIDVFSTNTVRGQLIISISNYFRTSDVKATPSNGFQSDREGFNDQQLLDVDVACPTENILITIAPTQSA